jgi:carboxylesterase
MNYLKLVYILIPIIVVAGIMIYNIAIGHLMDSYVQNSERNHAGIMKGAEPIELKAKDSKKAALLVHGFIGSPTDYGRLPQLLHERGYTVKVPLLPGHGTDPRDFSKTTAEELESFVLRHYREMKREYDEVVLIGFSMGGALSVLTSLEEPVDKLVLLAPYFKISHQWYYVLPTEIYQKAFMNIIPYTYRPLAFKQINNREAIPYMTDYDFVSLKGADAAIKLGAKALKNAHRMKQPTLIIHSTGDMATEYAASKKVAEELKNTIGAEFHTLTKSNHIILWDYDSKFVESSILKFLDKNTGNVSKGGEHAVLPEM